MSLHYLRYCTVYMNQLGREIAKDNENLISSVTILVIIITLHGSPDIIKEYWLQID